jgi:glycosyltransferase involved in cell wall biosynthesis
MKVLHCISTANIGGIERLVIELAIAQKKTGINVALMLDKKTGQFLDEIIQNEIPIYESKVKSGIEFSFLKQQSIKHIFNEFDIVHLHNFSLLRSYAAIKSKSKIVYTIHGLSKGIRKENFFKFHFRESIKRYFLNRVNYFIANSNHTLSLAKNHYGLKKTKTKTKVILNGIPFPVLKENDFVSDKEFTIGMVSRFTVRKRIERLINSFELFIKLGGKGKLQLIGDGDTFKSIQALIKEKELTDKIEMLGYKKNVHDFYNSFDVVVHPSDNEGFGLIAVESYINGKPILAFSDSGGLVEIINPLEPENIVQDEEQLALRLKVMSEVRHDIFLGCPKRKKYAIDNFSIERMEREYFEVYNQILNY